MSRTIDRAFPRGTRVSQPAGGFVLWVELPRPLKTRALLEEALEHGICFAPGDVFSASNRYTHCLRVSCGHRWDARIEAAVELLGGLAKQLA
jgi:DNA-binding transcriptional MocR family regulator